MTSFYRRVLPTSCVEFSSEEGKKLFKDALQNGNLGSYFLLAEQFNTQSEPAYCGLATLTMILNALSIDPGRTWKGPWRWFSEEMLECCAPLDVVQKSGITFSEFICIAQCNGCHIEAYRGNELTLKEFREIIQNLTQETSNDKERKFIAASYSRKTLGQTGDGHFSPLGAYSPTFDRVLIMDVARFKYPPHWVSVEELWNSCQKVDSVTQKPRGLVLLSRNKTLIFHLLRFRGNVKTDWKEFVNWIIKIKNCCESDCCSNEETTEDLMEITNVWNEKIIELIQMCPFDKFEWYNMCETDKESCSLDELIELFNQLRSLNEYSTIFSLYQKYRCKNLTNGCLNFCETPKCYEYRKWISEKNLGEPEIVLLLYICIRRLTRKGYNYFQNKLTSIEKVDNEIQNIERTFTTLQVYCCEKC